MSHKSSTTSSRERAPRRALPLALAVLALCVWAPTAHGHAVVQPTASRPAEQQIYTLTVPNERDSDVVSVSLQIPPQIDAVLVEEKPGWDVRLEREGDRIAVVRWSGGRIAGDQYDAFRFIARNPVQAGELEWKVIQQYTDATDRWIGPPDSEQPAARTQLSESATPVDAINTEEGGAASEEASGEPAASGGDGSGDGDSNTVPIVIGVVALVAALAALGVAISSRRRASA